jgi:hypothetical protein
VESAEPYVNEAASYCSREDPAREKISSTKCRFNFMIRVSQLLMFLILCSKSNSQSPGSSCDSAIIAPVEAYFDGYSYKYETNGFENFRMERSYFRNDFRLSLTDTSYKVVRFHLVADIETGLVSIVGNDKGIKAGENEFTKLLSKILKNGYVTVDNIRVSKNGQCYKVPSFICYFIK